MSPPNASRFTNDVERTARAAVSEAGALVRTRWQQAKTVQYKSAVDLVTETDRDVETLVVRHLQRAFPDHLIVAEEASAGCALQRPPSDRYVWYLDPLDGTTNFAHAYPQFCVSLALWGGSDALFGILMAEAAGLHGLLPVEHVAAHLRRVAERNWREFGDGQVGPTLLAPPDGPIPSGRTQVGEVLVGSARACVALMQRAGVREPGNAMADAINRTLYERSGLQFRIPAAWTAEATFRAPSNMRPLASWYSLWPERL